MDDPDQTVKGSDNWPDKTVAESDSIYSMLDAVPPIHAESSHVATDKGPLQVPVYF